MTLNDWMPAADIRYEENLNGVKIVRIQTGATSPYSLELTIIP